MSPRRTKPSLAVTAVARHLNIRHNPKWPCYFGCVRSPGLPYRARGSLRFAVSIDGCTPQVADFAKPSPWNQNVLRNAAITTIKFDHLDAGRHTAILYYKDLGVIFESLVFIFGVSPRLTHRNEILYARKRWGWPLPLTPYTSHRPAHCRIRMCCIHRDAGSPTTTRMRRTLCLLLDRRASTFLDRALQHLAMKSQFRRHQLQTPVIFLQVPSALRLGTSILLNFCSQPQ
jgi:hypothetical protein